MSKNNDISFDEETDILVNLEQMDARLKFLRRVYKQTNDFLDSIVGTEQYLYQSIKTGTEPYSVINKNLNKKDVELLELVSDYIEKELYPDNKDKYVFPYFYSNVMHYYNCAKDHEEAIPFTRILDIEFVHLNTCINIMKENNGFMGDYVNKFNYNDYNNIYNFLYKMYSVFCECGYSIKRIYNASSLKDDLLKLSLDELYILKCFVDAKYKLLYIIDRNREEDLEINQFVNNIVYLAYDLKKNQNVFERNKTE